MGGSIRTGRGWFFMRTRRYVYCYTFPGMGEIRRTLLCFAAILLLSGVFSTPAGIASTNPTVASYWIVYQPASPWPVFPTLWFFAPEGPANVVLRDHAGAETTVRVEGCDFTKFSLRNLTQDNTWLDWAMIHTEIRSDRPLWIVGEHRKPNGGYVPDPGLARPHTGLSRSYFMGAAWDKTTLNDAMIVVHAPTTANVTFKAWAGPYDQWDTYSADTFVERVVTRTITGTVGFEPYYLFALNSSWTLEVQSDTPVGVQVMDAGGFWRWDINGNGYQDDWVRMSGITNPSTEYIMDRDVTWAGARFPEGGGTLDVYSTLR